MGCHGPLVLWCHKMPTLYISMVTRHILRCKNDKIATNSQNNLKSSNLTQITNQFKLFDRNKQVIYPHPLNVTKAKFAGF